MPSRLSTTAPVHPHDPASRYIRADEQIGCNVTIISCPDEAYAPWLSGYAHYSPKVAGLKLTFVPAFTLDNVQPLDVTSV